MLQHCVSASVSVFQHMLLCFSICFCVSAYVTVFQHMLQHCVSANVPALFQLIFQHCVSAYVTALFQHMFQHCVSAYVPALCFNICFCVSVIVFNICFCVYSALCFSKCSSPVSAYIPTLCFSICYSTVLACVLALFHHMFQHCFSICSSSGFGLVPFFANCKLPFRLKLFKVDPPWLAGHFSTYVLVPALRLYLPPHPFLYSAPSGRGTLGMSQTFEGGGVSWPTNY
jgi:hypothetical protein